MDFFTSIWRQRNYRIAISFALLALAWLVTGVLKSEPQNRTAAATAGAEANSSPLRVVVRRINAQPFITRVVVNGRTEPNRSVRLKAELDGVIVRLPVAEGEAVVKGQVICEIGARDRPERLVQAKAVLRKAELDYAGAERLQKKGLQSETDMAQREVALANARAEHKRAGLDVDNLQIRAPFDGVVNRHAVELGDFVRRGDECATLLDLDPMLVVGEVAESQVAALLSGGPASAQLQEGQLLRGQLRYISRQADAVTRGYRVEVAVDNHSGALRGGLSGRLVLPMGEVSAHRINSSLLTLDDDGNLGVRTIDDDNRVQFVPVGLAGDSEDGVWVTGLSDPAALITVGQEYVSPGDVVAAEIEPAASHLSVSIPLERQGAVPATDSQTPQRGEGQ
ncbi:efflux RND transporter periplasmic adaptor subunit [Microbulbifer sp. 2201CG32-9]|uniref:efflux RND transporter periplasmic adaptor subunit n=1 Tax=unclassified Microbulbifer TaxID=2619833 RepID=UPI00345B6C6F